MLQQTTFAAALKILENEMKRSRGGDTLTGGTHDVNPQWLKFRVTQSGTDATTSGSTPLPVTRLANPSNPTIVEVLKVKFFPYGQTPAEADHVIQGYLGTKNLGTTATNPSEASLIAAFRQNWQITTSGATNLTEPIENDLTDNAGHGVLVATDNIYMQLQSASTAQTNTCDVWILYRFKRVTTLEYVGIVQGQQ